MPHTQAEFNKVRARPTGEIIRALHRGDKMDSLGRVDEAAASQTEETP